MDEEQITNRYVRGWIGLDEFRSEMVKFYDREDAKDMTMKTTIDLPFSPADIRAKAERQMREQMADKIWPAIMADPELKRARTRLSVHEFRLIVAHCLAAA